MKLVIRLKTLKRRAPHRPTKVEPQRVRYDRKKAKRSIREELQAEGTPN